MISTGTFQRSLDGKLRVLLPKQIRLGLDVEGPDSDHGGPDQAIQLFLTPGMDSCLELHTSESLKELALQARQNRPGTQNLKSFLRLFYARAHACEVDGQGRIRIPRELAELAGLEKEIVIAGVGFHWEVWDADRWQSYLSENQLQFDSIVETALDDVCEATDTVDQTKVKQPADHPSESMGRKAR